MLETRRKAYFFRQESVSMPLYNFHLDCFLISKTTKKLLMPAIMTAIMRAHNSGLQRMICDVSIAASWIFDISECNNFGVSTATSGKNKL